MCYARVLEHFQLCPSVILARTHYLLTVLHIQREVCSKVCSHLTKILLPPTHNHTQADNQGQRNTPKSPRCTHHTPAAHYVSAQVMLRPLLQQ